MRAAMAEAIVGDDVFGEDETINTLQAETALLLGKQAGLFVPSGTMGNQLAIKAQTEPGNELICEADSHIRYYEAGGAAFNSMVQLYPLHGERGVLTAQQVESAIQPDDVHSAPTALITLENTHNRAGGTIMPLENILGIREVATRHNLAMHLDGARLMNAVVASDVDAKTWSEPFDSVSICFSKGLGAPVGSVLCGSVEMIKKAHRYRKIFGGGMRQAGIIAAGALYALHHHVADLKIDHDRAQLLALALSEYAAVKLDPAQVQTNIVIFGMEPGHMAAEDVEKKLFDQGVLILALGPQMLRLVTHRDLTDGDMDRALDAFRKVFA